MAFMSRASAMAAILAAAGVSVAAASCSSSSAGAPATPTSDGGTDASAEALPDYRSGTRLRARLLTAEGGSALFKGWHDKDLDFDCAFGPAEDSMTRCLPQSRSLNDFADAACANRVVAASPGCVPPKFVSALGTCSTGAPVFRVGAKLAAATIYTKGTDGSSPRARLRRATFTRSERPSRRAHSSRRRACSKRAELGSR